MSDGEVCKASSNYVLNVRSYAPFDRFGGGFEGDNRGPSTSSTVSSRIAVRIVFNPVTGQIGKPAGVSSGTTFLPLGVKGRAEPKVSMSSGQRIPNGFVIGLDIAGANPLVAGAPDIDLHVTLRVALARGRLNVSGGLRGDMFPNAEVFLTDGAGTGRMIMTFETAGGAVTGPFANLPGDRARAMNGICYSFPVDAQGYFR